MITSFYRLVKKRMAIVTPIYNKRVGMNMAENTGDRTWGRLLSTEHFGRASNDNDYICVKGHELNNPMYKDCTQAGHCMIFARNNNKVFGVYHPRASILMQMRFDGYLGFPGGLIDSGEQILQGLNRELMEEMNIDLSKHEVTSENYIVSHYSINKKLCLHFYALELTLPELCEVERRSMDSKDYGSEVLGTIRVPLYTMGDGFRGFPVFLKNSFIGNSRNQLLYSLKHLNIMSDTELNCAITATKVT